MRKLPSNSPPDLVKKADLGQIIMTRTYKLITPLFGGGIEAGKVDDETPVRGSTIRGQLRFWWRATRGGHFEGDLAKMKAAEEAIWGSTKSASRVSISVKTLNRGTPFVVPKKDREGNQLGIGDPRSIYGYVGFPLRSIKGTVKAKIEFEVTFTFPDTPEDLRDGVQAALWAWETFGGVGARTRRGFGALSCTQMQMAPDSTKQVRSEWFWVTDSEYAKRDLMRQVQLFVSKGEVPRGVPYLSSRPARYRIRVGNDITPLTSWEDLISALKAFRQDRSGNRGFGRSKWPEPDAIRDITKQRGQAFNHNTPVHGKLIKKFPRAAFGLPIVFEFHPQQTHPTHENYDPRKTMLVGANVNRLASPLIIRPYLCRDRSVGLATVLEGPRPWHLGGLALKEGNEDGTILDSPLEARLTAEERELIKSEHDYYDGTPDILQSFLNIL